MASHSITTVADMPAATGVAALVTPEMLAKQPARFRLATAEDLPAIVAIYNATIDSRMVTADIEPVSVESRLAWFQEHDPQKRPLWVVDAAQVAGQVTTASNAAFDEVASQDGDAQVVAWLSFSDFYGRPAYAGTAEISIYVAEGARGKGVGRCLMQAAIDFAPQLNLHTLLGFIFGHNQPSLSLFSAFGFATWGHLPRVAVLDGIERDLLIVGKRVVE